MDEKERKRLMMSLPSDMQLTIDNLDDSASFARGRLDKKIITKEQFHNFCTLLTLTMDKYKYANDKKADDEGKVKE